MKGVLSWCSFRVFGWIRSLAALLAWLRTAGAQSLDGTWEITAVIDDGRVVEPTECCSTTRPTGAS